MRDGVGRQAFYEDKGCKFFWSCLNCPFPRCVEEEPGCQWQFMKPERADRMMEMIELRWEGKTLQAIARVCYVSVHTVYRWLKVAEPWRNQGFMKRKRADRIMELKREGKSLQAIARIYKVSPSTVYRWLN